MTTEAAVAMSDMRRPQVLVVVVAGVAILGIAGIAWSVAGPRQAALAVIGAGLGIALYHAAFGFTGSWRAFMAEGRSAGIRAQMLLLAAICVVSFPLVANGGIGDISVGGWVFPVSVSMALGAFLFGVGMQLGGGCGSGTLFTVGGGSTRMVVTLIFFIIGSLIATAHLPWWRELPSLGAYSGLRQLGLVPMLVLCLGAFAVIAVAVARVERRRRGSVQSLWGKGDPVLGPWPLAWGALALALLAILTFLVAGRPWGVTSAFALWGAKGAHAAGVDIYAWPVWQYSQARIEGSVFLDVTSVMDFGLIAGAFLAAGLAGKFAPVRSLPLGSLLAAIIGGLLLGYGARLAYGCNIGALLGGISSGSLHGWVWLLCAIPGNYLGMKLRPVFGMT